MYLKIILALIILPLSLRAGTTLPADGFLPGWRISDEVQNFTREDLYGHINGGAELFLEFGFDKLTVSNYTDGNHEIAFELYRMESPESALGIYLMKCGKENPDSSIFARNTVNRFQALAVSNNFFIQVNNFGGKDTLRSVMFALLNTFINELPAPPEIHLFDRLPKDNIISGSELIIRGPYGMQTIYTFGPKEILGLNGVHYAVLADYVDSNGASFTWIKIDYLEKTTARNVFENIQKNLDSYLKPIRIEEKTFVFSDYKNEFAEIELNRQFLSIKIHLKSIPN